MEGKGRERLHRMRISGTAIAGINMESTPEWQEMRDKLEQTFEEALDNLKQKLSMILPPLAGGS